MCGLTGIAGRDIYDMDLNFFRDLFYLSAFRGKDSTGVAAIKTRPNTWTIRKHDVPAAEFIAAYAGKRGILSDPNHDIIMGHSRWATKGVVNSENAHPFETDKYIGAHNGTLTDFRFQDKSGKSTDSELMFREMDKKGIVETISSLNPTSAYAVSIYDKATKKLWLGRNALRGLYVTFITGAGVMCWSSEEEMINFAAARDNGPRVSTYRLLPGFLYEIDVKEISKNNHTPWIVHELPKKVAHPFSEPRSPSEWDSAFMQEGWEDEDTYSWSKDQGRYIVKQRSEVSKILDEVEHSVEESRKHEQSLLI